VRLAGVGSSDREGRLEVYHDGRWGTVCDDYFNHVAAKVACNSLGFGWELPSLKMVVYCSRSSIQEAIAHNDSSWELVYKTVTINVGLVIDKSQCQILMENLAFLWDWWRRLACVLWDAIISWDRLKNVGFCDSVTVADVLGDRVSHLLFSPIVITIIHFVLWIFILLIKCYINGTVHHFRRTANGVATRRLRFAR